MFCAFLHFFFSLLVVSSFQIVGAHFNIVTLFDEGQQSKGNLFFFFFCKLFLFIFMFIFSFQFFIFIYLNLHEAFYQYLFISFTNLNFKLCSSVCIHGEGFGWSVVQLTLPQVNVHRWSFTRNSRHACATEVCC